MNKHEKKEHRETLAKCLLPKHMLEWFELTNVEAKPKDKWDEQKVTYGILEVN